MRNYGRFTTTMHRDDDFRALTLSQQGAYYLLGLQGEITAAGVLSLTLRRWSNMAEDLTPDGLADELKVLEDKGHILIDLDTEELLVVKFVKFDQGIKNEKRRPVIREAALAIASISIRHRLAHEIAALGYPDMASEIRGNAPSDAHTGFDRDVVKQGEYIPQPLNLNPEGEPPTTASPIPPADAGPPSMFCSKHPNGTEQPCGPCATARKRYAAWTEAKLAAEVEAKAAAAKARADCALCDDKGIRLHPETGRPLGRCDHTETTDGLG